MSFKLNEISSNLFLLGAILSANLDYTSIAEYAIKTFIGGIIWMGFKVGADYLSNKIKKNNP